MTRHSRLTVIGTNWASSIHNSYHHFLSPCFLSLPSFTSRPDASPRCPEQWSATTSRANVATAFRPASSSCSVLAIIFDGSGTDTDDAATNGCSFKSRLYHNHTDWIRSDADGPVSSATSSPPSCSAPCPAPALSSATPSTAQSTSEHSGHSYSTRSTPPTSTSTRRFDDRAKWHKLSPASS